MIDGSSLAYQPCFFGPFSLQAHSFLFALPLFHRSVPLKRLFLVYSHRTPTAASAIISQGLDNLLHRCQFFIRTISHQIAAGNSPDPKFRRQLVTFFSHSSSAWLLSSSHRRPSLSPRLPCKTPSSDRRRGFTRDGGATPANPIRPRPCLEDFANCSTQPAALELHHASLCLLHLYMSHLGHHLLGRFDACPERQFYRFRLPLRQCHDFDRVEHGEPV